jgi:hypothetical protein
LWDTRVMGNLYIILTGLVLFIPPGLCHHCAHSNEDSAHAWFASNAEELLTASEGEVEEPELFFHGVAFFEHRSQPDGHLPLNWSYTVHFAAVDPLGCRPPPAC